MAQKIQELLKESESCYLYGAQAFAYGIYKAVTHKYGMSVISFLVSNCEGNPTSMEHIPIIMADQVEKENRQRLVLIATPIIYHAEIMEYLDHLGFHNYIPIDSKLDYDLVGGFLHEKEGWSLTKDQIVCEEVSHIEASDKAIKNIQVLIAKSMKDKVLKQVYPFPAYAQEILLGASSLTEKTVGLTDHVGDHISDKNSLYAELTATYWAWKQIHKAYIGIFHYRRYLKVGEDELKLLSCGLADVILPLPYICYPNASSQYSRYVNETDIRSMKEALQACYPEYYSRILELLDGPYLYNYNILIAKREVFMEYCEFLFSVLFYIEENKLENKDRHDRYLAYTGEILTSLFFMLHKDKYKITHAELVWME